jgi:threonine dehydrogenase-like Zn-dependent dehydrogenase
MVGGNETILDAIDLVRPGFRVLVFGAQKMQLIPYEKCRKKGVELVYPEAMVNSKDDVDYWNAALDLIAGSGGKRLELEDLITRRISLAEAVRAFEFYDRGEWIKILVEPFRD